jgi:hypothetical protein
LETSGASGQYLLTPEDGTVHASMWYRTITFHQTCSNPVT